MHTMLLHGHEPHEIVCKFISRKEIAFVITLGLQTTQV